MTETVVKLRDLGGTHATGSVLNKPLSESVDQGPVLTPSNFPRAFNVGFRGAKGYILHMDLIRSFIIARM
jgi:hypothetical protein